VLIDLSVMLEPSDVFANLCKSKV